MLHEYCALTSRLVRTICQTVSRPTTMARPRREALHARMALNVAAVAAARPGIVCTVYTVGALGDLLDSGLSCTYSFTDFAAESKPANVTINVVPAATN